jgi:membrane protein DedA with SNARE-associated domain
VAGVLAADVVLYGTGRFWGRAVFRLRWADRALPPERRARLENGLRRHGLKLLLAGRLVPGSRTGIFLLAGVLRYPFARFLIIDGAAAAVSVGIVFFGVGLLTDWLTPMFGEGRGFWSWILLGVGVAAAGVTLLVWRLRRGRVSGGHARVDRPRDS